MDSHNNSTLGRVPRVFSYMRFSTPEQATGHSERRQDGMAEAYAKKHGFILDTKLRMKDRGKSAYDGSNIRSGALGEFLELVKKGEVLRGDVLLVESVDRISRMQFFEAFSVISGLIQHGIVIHTLLPEMTYDQSCASDGRVYTLVGQVMLANSESHTKSKRLREAWSQKLELAHSHQIRITSVAPAWLDTSSSKDDPAMLPKPHADSARTIRAIFDFTLKGRGKTWICKKLNAGGYWLPPVKRKEQLTEKWRESYISKILGNRAVLGEHQPHRFTVSNGNRVRIPEGPVLLGYYPRIVDAGTFEQVQRILRARKGKGAGGRVSSARNLFPGIAKCAYCGGPMNYKDNGSERGGYKYLVCENGKRRLQCKTHSVRHDELLETVLQNCRRLKPELIIQSASEQAAQCTELQAAIDSAVAKYEANQRHIENLVDQMARTQDRGMRDLIESKVHALRKTGEAFKIETRELRSALERLQVDQQSVSKWQATLDDLIEAIEGDTPEAAGYRMHLQAHLRQLITRIEIFARGWPKATEPGDFAFTKTVAKLQFAPPTSKAMRWMQSVELPMEDELMEPYFEAPKAMRSDAWLKEIKRLQALRATKRGRFFRVYFSTGFAVDLVPVGSVASGSRIEIDEDGKKCWHTVSPVMNVAG